MKPLEPMIPDVNLITAVNQQLYTLQLGLLSISGLVPVLISLTPWQLGSAQFARAQRLATLLGQIQARAAVNPKWLLKQLDGLKQSKTVPGQLWHTLRNIYPEDTSRTPTTTNTTSRNLMLNRHDFLLDQQQQWKWVESNPIAVGMGPLNDRYLAVMQTQELQQPHHRYAPNDAITTQTKLLAQAALASALQNQTTGSVEPLMLIVVEADEDNIFDQKLLCDEVGRLCVRAARLTINDLLQTEFAGNERLHWQAKPVDLIYWRTGYNSSADLTARFGQFRAPLEQAAVIQCPNLAGQLTGCKWFQHQFTALLLANPQQVSGYFGIEAAEIALLIQAVVPSHAVSELKTATAEELIAQGYWYKTQQEGGGNVARGQAALDKLTNADSADLLMAPINAEFRREAINSLRQGRRLLRLNISASLAFSVWVKTPGTVAIYAGRNRRKTIKVVSIGVMRCLI